MASTYKRPGRNSNAKLLGYENRTKFTNRMINIARRILNPLDLLTTEESYVVATLNRQGSNRSRWINTQLSPRHLAIIDILQARYLATTGTEVSRAEVIAALMAAGLDEVAHSADLREPLKDGIMVDDADFEE